MKLVVTFCYHYCLHPSREKLVKVIYYNDSVYEHVIIMFEFVPNLVLPFWINLEHSTLKLKTSINV